MKYTEFLVIFYLFTNFCLPLFSMEHELVFEQITRAKLPDIFLEAACSGEVKVLKQAIGAGVDINAKYEKYHNTTALIEASSRGHSNIVKILLKCPGIEVNFQNKLTITALIGAVTGNHIDIVKSLLTFKDLEVNTKDVFQNTVLIWATTKRFIEIAKLLLNDCRIDVNASNKCNETALHRAVKRRSLILLKLLLDQPQIDINILDCKDNSPLMLALLLDNIRAIQLLVAAGARIPRMSFLQLKFEDVIMEGRVAYKTILQAGITGDMKMKQIAFLARQGFTLNIKDNAGSNPLHNAVEKNDKLVVVTVLGYNPALICIKNRNGLAALELAIECDHWEIVICFLNLAYS